MEKGVAPLRLANQADLWLAGCTQTSPRWRRPQDLAVRPLLAAGRALPPPAPPPAAEPPAGQATRLLCSILQIKLLGMQGRLELPAAALGQAVCRGQLKWARGAQQPLPDLCWLLTPAAGSHRRPSSLAQPGTKGGCKQQPSLITPVISAPLVLPQQQCRVLAASAAQPPVGSPPAVACPQSGCWRSLAVAAAAAACACSCCESWRLLAGCAWPAELLSACWVDDGVPLLLLPPALLPLPAESARVAEPPCRKSAACVHSCCHCPASQCSMKQREDLC